MNDVFFYHLILAILQPTRITEIVAYARDEFPGQFAGPEGEARLREVHASAKRDGSIIQVRKGSYCITKHTSQILRGALGGGAGKNFSSEIDNQRIFMLKKARKAVR